jgi:hypothetical protein
MLLLDVGSHAHEAKQEGAIHSIPGILRLSGLDFGGWRNEAVDVAHLKYGFGCGGSGSDTTNKV